MQSSRFSRKIQQFSRFDLRPARDPALNRGYPSLEHGLENAPTCAGPDRAAGPTRGGRHARARESTRENRDMRVT